MLARDDVLSAGITLVDSSLGGVRGAGSANGAVLSCSNAESSETGGKSLSAGAPESLFFFVLVVPAGGSCISGGTFTVERIRPSALLSGFMLGPLAYWRPISGADSGSRVLKLRSTFLKNKLKKIIRMTRETATVEKNRINRLRGPMRIT